MKLGSSGFQRRLMRWGWSRRLVLWLTGDRILTASELAEKLSCASCWEQVEPVIDCMDDPEPLVRVVMDPMVRVVIKRGRVPVSSCWHCDGPLEEMPAF